MSKSTPVSTTRCMNCAIPQPLSDSIVSASFRISLQSTRNSFLRHLHTTDINLSHKSKIQPIICPHGFIIFGALVLVTAGVMYFTSMKNLHEDEWERTVDVNCKGTMFGVGAVLGGMIERGSGHIVNISSDAGRRIFPSLAVYSASKFFVEAMSEGLRREIVGTGLKVTTIQPGDCATDLIMNNTDKEAAEEQGVSIGVKVGTGSTTNQVLQPADVAAAVLYAVTAPTHVAINEVLVEPRDQA
ncbi:unnamed protein product [Laminaria digitata]